MQKVLNKSIFAVIVSLAAGILALSSCNKYLDIVPDDGIATVDMSFNMRSSAIKWLSSIYSFRAGSDDCGILDTDSAMLGGDEMWSEQWRATTIFWDPAPLYIARGRQAPTMNYGNNMVEMYQAVRYCNTLIDRIYEVPDMKQWEQDQWVAEAKVLKAYYIFRMVRKFGPIPLPRESVPVSAATEEVRVYRDDIDECFDYIFSLIDEALPFLPEMPRSRDEYGRIDIQIATAFKAKAAVYAASPLFNNNTDERLLVDNRGVQLFPEKSEEDVRARWEYAMEACKQAIDVTSTNKSLYRYSGTLKLNDTLTRELSLRNYLFASFNSESVWVNTQAYGGVYQEHICPNLNPDQYPDLVIRGEYTCVPMKIANQFYTKHGIPVENDPERNTVNPESIRRIGADHRWYMREGYYTAEFNFEREPRFYADLGFDGSLWGMPNRSNPASTDIAWISRGRNLRNDTGYGAKKLVSYEARVISSNSWSTNPNQWNIIRLADLYLLYAEAINEAEGPSGPHSEDMFKYINLVRSRAGIPDVKTSWDVYSNAPGYYNTQAGMRKIIHRERLIELAFEGQRFWDLRRWKEASAEFATPVQGWSYKNQGTRENYYKVTTLYKYPAFTTRDYFWPIAIDEMERNPNLVQNYGW